MIIVYSVQNVKYFTDIIVIYTLLHGNVKFFNIGQHWQKIKTKCVPLLPSSKHSLDSVQNKNNIILTGECLILISSAKVSLSDQGNWLVLERRFSLITITTIITIGSIEIFLKLSSAPPAPISRMINTHTWPTSVRFLSTKDIYGIVRKIFARPNIVQIQQTSHQFLFQK